MNSSIDNDNSKVYPPRVNSGSCSATPDEKPNVIDDAIKRGSFKEAIEALDFRLESPGSLKPEVVFEYFKILLPHMEDEKYFRSCVGKLKNFLELTSPVNSHLYLQQYDIALQLGDEYEKRGKYVEAMGCFAQGIKIAQHQKATTLEKDAHIKASKLLFSRIQNSFFLTVEAFEEKLTKARTIGVLKFRELLEWPKNLKQFCITKQHLEFIEKLFKCARTALMSKVPLWHFQPFVNLIAIEEDAILNEKDNPSVNTLASERYQNALNQFRACFNNFPKTGDLRAIQAHATKEFKKLFEVFLTDAFTVLGEPPCAYDIRAIGSVGREEPLPCSDLEFFVLIKEEAHRKYFETLLEFLQLQVVSLGETPDQPITFTCLGEEPKGYYLDPDGVPLNLEQKDLMDEPIKMASNQEKEIPPDLPAEDIPKCHVNKVLASISLKSSCPQLFSDFQEAKNSILAMGKEMSIRKIRARRLFQTRLDNFKEKWPNPSLPNPIKIKDCYVPFLNFFLADLALYFGVEATNTLDITDALEKVLNARSRDLLKEAVSFIYPLRVRLHQFYGKHNEEATFNGLSSRCSLMESEKTELEKIYWLVLRPLYEICLPRFLEKNEPVESVFKDLDFISVCLDEVYSSEKNSQFFIPVIRFIATHLNKEPIEIHLAVFKKLSRRSDQEDLREAYLKVLEENRFEEHQLRKIREIPNSAGHRPSFLMRENDLKARIEDITVDELPPFDPKAEWFPRVMVRTSRGIRFLRPEIAKEIIDPKSGELKQVYPGSRHHVTSAAGLHFKQRPTHPLMEYAIHSLFFRLAGDLTPSTELVRFEVDGGKPYPVLISTTVPGNTLKTRLPLKLEKSQWARWTWMLLCSVLTRPGDGRLSNYILDLLDNIFCVDNDISFADPYVEGRLSSQVNFFSALFCLPPPFHNRPLDPEVLREFCNLDADAILPSWIDDVIQKEDEYSTLFSEKDEKRLHDENPQNRFKVTAEFREGAGATLITQFIYLQNHLDALLKQNKIPTPPELLKYIISLNENPHLTNRPGLKVSDRYLQASQASAEERLQWILSRSPGESMSSLQSDQICLGRTKSPSFEEVKKKKLFSARKAKAEMELNILQRSPHFVVEGRMHGKKITQVNFKEFWVDGIPEVERQRSTLLALTSRLGNQLPSSLALQHCAVLNTVLLDPFLHPDLEYLDLSDCPMIKNSDIELMANKCPKLKELYLSGCDGLTNLEGGRVFSEPLKFPSLQVFYINKCPNLKRISLRSPCLRILNGDNNSKLTGIERTCFLKFEPSVKNCPKLEKNIAHPVALESINPEAFKDKEFVLAALADRRVCKYISEELKQDREFVLAAANRTGGFILQCVSEELKRDKEFVLEAVTKNIFHLQYVSEELKRDREFVLATVTRDGSALEYASEEFKSDREVVLAALTHRVPGGGAIQYASYKLRSDREIVLAAATQDGWALQYVSRDLRCDREIVLAAITENGWALEFVSQELKGDREVVLTAVTKNPEALEFASLQLKSDRELVLTAVTQNERALRYASGELRRDREFVLDAMTRNGWAFQFADEVLKRDREFVLAAVTKNGWPLAYATEELKRDREFVLAAVAKDGWNFEYASEELKKDREIVLAAVTQNGLALQFASEEVMMDQSFVLAAVTQNPAALRYTIEELKRDRAFLLRAVSQKGLALKYVSEEFKRDREIVLAAVTQNGLALEYASIGLKGSKEIVLAAVKQNPQAQQYADNVQALPAIL